MNISKDALSGFLRKVSVKGRVSEAVIEPDGTVTISSENELIVVGKSDAIKFGTRVGVKNIGLIAKVSADIAAADLSVTLEDVNIKMSTSDEKFEFRCADPATVESLCSDREKIISIKEKLEGVKLEDFMIKRIRKAVSNLNADRISLFADAGRLFAVVMDTTTESKATVDICGYKGAEFKHDFNAKIVDDVLDLAGDNGAMLFAGNKSALFVEMISKDFLYMVSYIEGGE